MEGLPIHLQKKYESLCKENLNVQPAKRQKEIIDECRSLTLPPLSFEQLGNMVATEAGRSIYSCDIESLKKSPDENIFWHRLFYALRLIDSDEAPVS